MTEMKINEGILCGCFVLVLVLLDLFAGLSVLFFTVAEEEINVLPNPVGESFVAFSAST